MIVIATGCVRAQRRADASGPLAPSRATWSERVSAGPESGSLMRHLLPLL